MAESLWGEIPEERRRVPAEILKEQAAELSTMTRGLLEGYVTSSTLLGNIRLSFDVVAPLLDHYKMQLLTVDHPVEMYPLSVRSDIGQHLRLIECEDEGG